MEEVADNPFELFKKWYDEAQEIDIAEPGAMTLSTCGDDNQPSSRIVLLRGFDERGFAFYTNYTSRKGRELNENAKAALCFYWEDLGKQINIEGTVEKTDDHESDAYFESRPHGSKISAWASKQSMPINTPEELPNRIKELSESFKDQPITRPPFWGGYRVVPKRIEFWQRGEHRLHTRISYELQGEKWVPELLYP